MNTSKTCYFLYVMLIIVGLSLVIPGSSSTLTIARPVKAKIVNSTVTINPGHPIEVAFAMWFGWVTAQDSFDAMQMAIDDYGQIMGFDIKLNKYDAGCDSSSGASAASDITSNSQNVGVVGPFCSISTQGALPVLESADFVMISPSNTGVNLYDSGPNAFNRIVIADPGFQAFDAHVNSLPSTQAWEADFFDTFSRTPETYAKYTYDAATLLLTRIEEVSSLDGGGNLIIDREELRNAVRTTTLFSAVTGPITLDAFGTRIDFFSQAVWNDEYEDILLNDRWSWIDEDTAHWSLTANPGFMQITSQSPGMNRLVQMAPTNDFVIRTRLLFTPVENYQFSGLTVFNDMDNKLVLGRAFCDTAPPACAGNGIYFDHVENGYLIGENFATSITSAGEAYLRLERKGSNYTGYVSENGTDWQEIGTHAIGFDPLYIGFYVDGQSSTIPTPADFDFFILTYDKHRLFLPLAQKTD